MGILANGEKTIHSDGAKHNRSSQSALKSFDQIHLFLPILTFCPDPSIFMGWISVPWLQPVDCVESVEVELVGLGASAGAARSILATCASNAMQMAFAYVALHSENIFTA